MENINGNNPAMDLSALIEKISAMSKKYNNATGIHISITEKGHDSDDGSKSLIKWLCWNLFSENDEFITAPDLVAVNGDIDQNELNKNISEKFGKYKCIIDNDIQFE